MTTAKSRKEDEQQGRVVRYEENDIVQKPYYLAVGSEVEDMLDAWELRHPVALLGPTGCGKTTLAEHVAYLISEKVQQKYGPNARFPYIEIPCHEDITERHFLGGFGADGKWMPGPLYIGATAPYGAMIVFDEFVEARQDAQVLIHGATDDRRVISVPKKGETIYLPPEFIAVICYNPGYQVRAKALKPSTQQRFTTLILDYPSSKIEEQILQTKTQIDSVIAKKLVAFANEIRNKARGTDTTLNLQEGASTRLLVRAAERYQHYLQQDRTPNLKHIASICIINPITGEATNRQALEQLLDLF